MAHSSAHLLAFLLCLSVLVHSTVAYGCNCYCCTGSASCTPTEVGTITVSTCDDCTSNTCMNSYPSSCSGTGQVETTCASFAPTASTFTSDAPSQVAYFTLFTTAMVLVVMKLMQR